MARAAPAGRKPPRRSPAGCRWRVHGAPNAPSALSRRPALYAARAGHVTPQARRFCAARVPPIKGSA
eukprot:11162715-Lingulodinium_polyedra.AAC.1